MATIETTRLNRSWLAKMTIFLVVLLVFGVWGLYDALYAYPARGLADARYKQHQYLLAMQKAGKLELASIPDPAAKLGVLAAKRQELTAAVEDATKLQSLAGGTTPEAQQAAAALRRIQGDVADAAALTWLDSLKVVGQLDDRALTTMASPSESLQKLDTEWKTAAQPKPLAAYDLPLQWFFVFAGFGGSLYVVVFVLLPAARTVYQWDPETQRLTLPGGRTLVPSDIAEFDKRKWDRFFIFLHLKPSAEGGAGTIKLDLLRHAKLEEWILMMERTAFPETALQPEPSLVAPDAKDGNATTPNPNT